MAKTIGQKAFDKAVMSLVGEMTRRASKKIVDRGEEALRKSQDKKRASRIESERDDDDDDDEID